MCVWSDGTVEESHQGVDEEEDSAGVHSEKKHRDQPIQRVVAPIKDAAHLCHKRCYQALGETERKREKYVSEQAMIDEGRVAQSYQGFEAVHDGDFEGLDIELSSEGECHQQRRNVDLRG